MDQPSNTQSSGIEPDHVLPRSDWRGVLAETITEVFSIMAGADVTMTDAVPTEPMPLTGIVGIAGAIRASFTLLCTDESARQLASQMLGISPDDPGSLEASYDALGEICNIVAGYFKAKIGLGEACMLSVPTIVSGQNYCFRSRNNYDRLELTVAYEKHLLQAVVEIAK
jgi:chemotaxis protein CheX